MRGIKHLGPWAGAAVPVPRLTDPHAITRPEASRAQCRELARTGLSSRALFAGLPCGGPDHRWRASWREAFRSSTSRPPLHNRKAPRCLTGDGGGACRAHHDRAMARGGSGLRSAGMVIQI